jgi:hypothetical protein
MLQQIAVSADSSGAIRAHVADASHPSLPFQPPRARPRSPGLRGAEPRRVQADRARSQQHGGCGEERAAGLSVQRGCTVSTSGDQHRACRHRPRAFGQLRRAAAPNHRSVPRAEPVRLDRTTERALQRRGSAQAAVRGDRPRVPGRRARLRHSRAARQRLLPRGCHRRTRWHALRREHHARDHHEGCRWVEHGGALRAEREPRSAE